MSKIIKKIKYIKGRMINMFKFNKQSGCVQVWITLIVGGIYKFEQCPKLFNLREMVGEVLKDMGAIEEPVTTI
ncbi:hypothetical protein [Clostridium tagluense]|uniref:hypothetical protein n=1 Tax=Clostridium tagluense TaxID=360422 RepID=UPI001C6EBA01|nr:hypothetical protein [Clostridium tagluense]MBW9159759.1 hypothetical protein [Clostridium tagluense]WLC68055.1 hypothetical protein KTC93_15685 [Clostridium tagluense]WLC68059.1 hypothetical protein KTC93_08280 [Clostridium tagluense]